MQYYKDLLTIGIPVYNEGRYIRQAIESCINQAGTVIVSDNASTDDTQKICEELLQKYSNLVYVRRDKNIGAVNSFNGNVNLAKTKYFMSIGGHDYLDDGYTQHMLHMLENSDASGCMPASRSVDINGVEMGIYDCWFADRLASDSPSHRVYSLICHLHDVAALFGIYRTEILKKYPLKQIIGNDHVLVCSMAFEGRLLYSARSIYNWRQTKMDLSDEERIKTWQQVMSNEIEASRREMKCEQLAILKKCGTKGCGFFGKIYLNFKARRKLNKRFGK